MKNEKDPQIKNESITHTQKNHVEEEQNGIQGSSLFPIKKKDEED